MTAPDAMLAAARRVAQAAPPLSDEQRRLLAGGDGVVDGRQGPVEREPFAGARAVTGQVDRHGGVPQPAQGRQLDVPDARRGAGPVDEHDGGGDGDSSVVHGRCRVVRAGSDVSGPSWDPGRTARDLHEAHTPGRRARLTRRGRAAAAASA